MRVSFVIGSTTLQINDSVGAWKNGSITAVVGSGTFRVKVRSCG